MRILFLSVLIWCFSLQALVTAYVKFDHPEGWRCELVEGVFVCQSMIEPDRHESLVLSIAALATEWDTLENYENFLKNPKPVTSEDGKILEPTITYVRKRDIRGQSWIDSLQMNSELPGFYSRYLATVHQAGGKKLAVLITYIVSEARYSALAPVFERMIGSLQMNNEFDLNTPSSQSEAGVDNNANLPLGLQAKSKILDKLRRKEAILPADEKKANGNALPLLIGAVVAVLVLVLVRQKKKQKKGNSPRKQDPKF